jgi:farnesyl diphosphate synthase
MNAALNFTDWAALHQVRIEAVLDEVLPQPDAVPQKLHSAMRYSVMGGGKRVRALLCYAAAELCHTHEPIADAAAAAVELIHAYSLVHDDMPCMDNDDLRRGKPSCHKQYDDATALLVGDALQSLAFDVLSRPDLSKNPTQQISMLNQLAKASGSYGMAGGQAIDLDAVGKIMDRQQIKKMHQRKTGALIQVSALLGAAGGTLAQMNAILNYAENIGLAFQVVDDILDTEADTATLGKTAGKDADSNKPTYISILGLTAAKQFAETLYQDAIAALEPFDDEALRLRELANFITQRSF